MKVIKHKDKWYLQSDTGYKEILLSTDKLLIKDGVQAIDDDFLEWFVKNPSCEEVIIEEFLQASLKYPKGSYKYKIIIQKEEPKQSIEEYEQQGLEKYSYELKQEITLKEAAILNCQSITHPYCDREILMFIKGAKWQQEQDRNKYSEEDMKHAFFSGCQSERQIKPRVKCLEEFIEQFKKHK
jgi:hypothetical protein